MGPGRETVREALHMAALSAAHHNTHLKDFCRKLRDGGKTPKVALCAVARKLLIALKEPGRKVEPVEGWGNADSIQLASKRKTGNLGLMNHQAGFTELEFAGKRTGQRKATTGISG